MKTKILFFAILLCSNLSNAQERDQYVKWGASVHYTKSLEIRLEDSVNPAIFCDVAIGHNDVFDSAPIYFGFYFDYAIRNSNEVNSISGGANIKKFIDFGNTKRDFYFLAGGKLTFFKNYERYMSDYSLNLGIGVVLNSFTEINSIYNHGITNSYVTKDFEHYKSKSISIGIKIFFQNNWWY